jgi:Tol biopolymer transport system component
LNIFQNAGLGEYNLYAGSVLQNDAVLERIQESLKPRQYNGYFMVTEEFSKDGQARVSPDGKKIVFSSGRTGNGDLYLFDITSGTLSRLTTSPDTDLYPQWSPDGKDIVFTTGGKTAHDIHVIRDVGLPNQREEVLIYWFFDDILPSFSPDGKYISFYTTYNLERDPFNTKRWGIMIVPSDGSGPGGGTELTDYFHIPDVIKDNTQGTAWFPDSRHIIFAKNIDSDYNPIYIYDIQNRTEEYIDTGTSINHDITVSRHGFVSFRAQQLGWDRIFVASSTFFQEYLNAKHAK